MAEEMTKIIYARIKDLNHFIQVFVYKRLPIYFFKDSI